MIERVNTVRRMVQDFEWFHTMIGILGNISFVIGSWLFLFGDASTRAGWFFIAGSSGMLVGSLGAALVRHERKKNRWARPGSWDDIAERDGLG